MELELIRRRQTFVDRVLPIHPNFFGAMIRVDIVEDDEDIRKALQVYLDEQAGFGCTGAHHSIEKLLHALHSHGVPDVIIMDLGLPGMSGIEGIKLVKDQYAEVNIIVFSIYNDFNKIFESLCAGACGYLLKTASFREIREGITLLADGGAPMSPQIARKVIDFFAGKFVKPAKEIMLSEREQEIVAGLVDGLSYKLIADRMHVSLETVRYHIKNIYRKLHVNCRSQVISKSLRGEI